LNYSDQSHTGHNTKAAEANAQCTFPTLTHLDFQTLENKINPFGPHHNATYQTQMMSTPALTSFKDASA